MSSPKEQKVDEVIERFRASGSQEEAFDQLAAQALGIGPTDLACATIVERRGGVTAGELAAESGLTTGAVTGVVDRLERAGYAAREPDPADRRKVIVRVTDRFYEAAGEIWGPMAAEWRAELAERFTRAELETIASFLEQTTAIGARHANRLRARVA